MAAEGAPAAAGSEGPEEVPKPPSDGELRFVFREVPKAKARAARRQRQRDRDARLAGASAAADAKRSAELEQLDAQLRSAGLRMHEVQGDGHCLYRAVAAAVGGGASYQQMRNLAADTIQRQAADFQPFLETGKSLEGYCAEIRETPSWGGDVELEALSRGLEAPIFVFAADQAEPRAYGAGGGDRPMTAGINLTFHRAFVAAGPHYNAALPG